MNIHRFLAPNTREALARARAVFGDDAVILATRASAEGVEVTVTSEPVSYTHLRAHET